MYRLTAIVQTIVEEQLRGRVMAFYTMAFLGTAPIGSLVAGVVADRIGAAHTVTLGGAACIAGGLWFRSRLPMVRKALRPLYEAQGILTARQAPTIPAIPEVDSGAKTMMA